MLVFDVSSFSLQYRRKPRNPRVNTKTIGPVGHPGKPKKGFGGNMGVRTLDISEYEDSREYPKYRPTEREYRPEHLSPNRYEYSRDYPKYRPAEQDFGSEDPPPDRYEDSREYRPEYPSPYRH